MIEMGGRRELFTDGYLIDALKGVELRLHEPTRREVALMTDEPWEGNNCGYFTVFQEGGRYRMIYRSEHFEISNGKRLNRHSGGVCYAESDDGVNWTKPDLGLFEFEGSRDNNIIWQGAGSHNFTPFRDENPDCPAEAAYKALGGGGDGLHAFMSPDGVNWSLMADAPVITEGKFDSQNLAFWDATRGEYREYHRGARDGRDIMTTSSRDFLQWETPRDIDYSPGRLTELYTNQILPYHRAPHIFLGFPTRYITDRKLLTSVNEQISALSMRFGTDYTDGGFMTSRDGLVFTMWPEAFIRPGPVHQGRWAYGANYQAWGLVETTTETAAGFLRPHLPKGVTRELSLYATEDGWFGESRGLRRYTLRLDGFVSACARQSGGELITKPLRFTGGELVLNAATSAAGLIGVEVQDASSGCAVEGFAMADCEELFGDAIEMPVRWTSGKDLSALAGTPVRLRFALRDADLYSLQFRAVVP